MYDDQGQLAVPGLESGQPIGGLQRDLDQAQLRSDAGVVDSYRLAGTDSACSVTWTRPSCVQMPVWWTPTGWLEPTPWHPVSGPSRQRR